MSINNESVAGYDGPPGAKSGGLQPDPAGIQGNAPSRIRAEGVGQDWNIKPRGPACCNCRAEFADSQVYVSQLDFGGAGYGRSDFCEKCWTSRDATERAVSVWRGVYKTPPPPREEPIRKETAESLLRRIMDEGDGARANVIFILAVLLERRRVLVEKEVRRHPDGARLRVYEHRLSGETFVVTDPMLQMDRLKEVQQEVMDMLAHNQ